MRKLLFIDNDGIQKATEAANMFAKPFLSAYGDVNEEMLEGIEVLPDLYKCDRDMLYNKFYSGDYVIVSMSAYTIVPSFYNSKDQLLNFLRVAGTSEVKDIVYIDISGYLEKTLSGAFQYQSDLKGAYNIMWAIENNWIVTLEEGKFYRIRIDFTQPNGLRKDTASIEYIHQVD